MKREASLEIGFFPPDVTLHASLMQAIHKTHSTQAAVDRVNAERKDRGLKLSSSNTGNYTRARQRLAETLVMRLMREHAENLEKEVPFEWLWQGRRVRLIDGSTILLPDSEENQLVFPQHGNQEEGSGFPIARIVALISLATGLVVDFALGPFQGKETGELALARQLLQSLSHGDIVVADRYYCSYFFIALLRELGVDLVSRLHGARTADFREGNRISKGDHLIILERPARPDWMDKETYGRMPKTITVREVKAKLDKAGFRSEDLIVVTTLLDHKNHPRQDILNLYDQRWHCEIDLRNLKSTMDLDMLRTKTPAMIRKELWIAFLAHNLIRQMIAQAAHVHNVKPRTLSFKGAIDAFLAFSIKWHDGDYEHNARLYIAMLQVIAEKRVGQRPGRSEPRMVKRRPKPFPRLKGSRHQYKKTGAMNSAGR